MKTTVKLSEELVAELIPASSAYVIKKDALEIMASVGADLTTPAGLAFIEDVTAASAVYNRLYHKAVLEAEAGGYDPALGATLKLQATHGYISWEVDKAPAPEDGNETA